MARLVAVHVVADDAVAGNILGVGDVDNRRNPSASIGQGEEEEVVVMGDGFNDVSMISYAGLGVAVANAPDGVKEHANYVTIANHNEDAVWEVYEKFFK